MNWTQSDTRLGMPACLTFCLTNLPVLSLHSDWYSSLVFGTCFATIELSRRSGLAWLSSHQLQIEIWKSLDHVIGLRFGQSYQRDWTQTSANPACLSRSKIEEPGQALGTNKEFVPTNSLSPNIWLLYSIQIFLLSLNKSTLVISF